MWINDPLLELTAENQICTESVRQRERERERDSQTDRQTEAESGELVSVRVAH